MVDLLTFEPQVTCLAGYCRKTAKGDGMLMIVVVKTGIQGAAQVSSPLLCQMILLKNNPATRPLTSPPVAQHLYLARFFSKNDSRLQLQRYKSILKMLYRFLISTVIPNASSFLSGSTLTTAAQCY